MIEQVKQHIDEEKRFEQSKESSSVFSGKFESETTRELYNESAKIISDIIKEKLDDKTEKNKFVDFGSYKGELLKEVLNLLPGYNFHTIGIDVEKNLEGNEVVKEKIVANMTKKIPLDDHSVDIGMMRYVLTWNNLEEQQNILKEIARIVKKFVVIQHGGADNDNTDMWRKKMDDFLSGEKIPRVKRKDYFFSSREEIEKLMIENNIKFERVMERRVDKVSNVFIERFSLNENEAEISRGIFGDKDYVIQTTWLILSQ